MTVPTKQPSPPPFPAWEFIQRGYDATFVHPQTLSTPSTSGQKTGTRQFVFSMNPSVSVSGPTGTFYSKPAECDAAFQNGYDEVSAGTTSFIQASSDIGTAFSASIFAGDPEGELFSCSASLDTQQQQSTMSERDTVYSTVQAAYHFYQLSLLATASPKLSSDFQASLAALATPQDVKTLIDVYGTHYATKVAFGGLATLTYTMSQAELSDLTQKQVNMQADVSAAFGVVSAGGKVSTSTKVSSAFKTKFGDTGGADHTTGGVGSFMSSTWPATVPGSPVPVSVDLMPLYTLPQLTDGQRTLLTNGIKAYLTNPGVPPLSQSIVNYGDTVVLQPVNGISPNGLNLVSQPGVKPSGSSAGVQSSIAVPPGATNFYDLWPGGAQLDPAPAGLQLINDTDVNAFRLVVTDPGNAASKGPVDYSKPLCFAVANTTPQLLLDSEAGGVNLGQVGLSSSGTSANTTQWTVTPLYAKTQPSGTEDAYASLAHRYTGAGSPPLNLVHGDPVSIKRVAPTSTKNPNDRQGYLMVLSGNLVSKGDYSSSTVSGNSCFFRILLVEKAKQS